jgi:hypothetical protein
MWAGPGYAGGTEFQSMDYPTGTPDANGALFASLADKNSKN